MNISTISPAKFDTGKSVTLSGTGFGSSQGTVTIGGQAQTVTSWSDTSITFTSVRGAQSMGACRVDVVKASGASGGTAALAWSAPAGLADGNTLTITTDGTYSFGTKTTAAPVRFERFAGLTPGNTLQSESAAWSEYQSYGGAVVSNADSHSGTVCARNDSARNGFGTCYHQFTASNEVYVSYWMKVANIEGNETGGGAILKFLRIGAIDGGGPYNGAGIHSLSSHSPATLSNGLISNGYMSYSKNSTHFSGALAYLDAPVNVWCRVEMWAKLSTAGVANGNFHCRFVNGASGTFDNIENRGSGETWQLSSVILGLMHANFSAGSFEIYNDDIYIDNTRKRVEVGNNAIYANCTLREPQPSSAWSASSITVSLNTPNWSGDKWLFVLDDANAVVCSASLGDW